MTVRLAFLALTALVASGSADPASARRAQGDPRVVRADLARIAGSPTAKVWILVVSDFQCPYCKAFHDSTSRLLHKEFVATGKARLAYINYPLRQHANAVPAAEAAMCAGAQDRFWPFHDRLFAAIDSWGTATAPLPLFEQIATSLRLDLPAWRKCMSDHVMQPMIRSDHQRGLQAGARSTPTFIIGSAVIAGNAPVAVIRKAVNDALAGAR
jgi:protein-disulfide isomerase